MAIIKLSSAKISVRIGIDYICNEEKTLGKLISGKGCMPESCYDEFEIVRNNLNKQGGQTYYHMIQSFAQDDNISPEKCHEIGMQMAEHCFTADSDRLRFAVWNGIGLILKVVY